LNYLYYFSNNKFIFEELIRVIEGQIDGKKMEMWYNGDYDFEIDFPD